MASGESPATLNHEAHAVTGRPFLTTQDCARYLGVSAAYVREELKSGRLEGDVIPRPCLPGRRWAKTLYRVYPADFKAYCAKYWPRIDTSRLPAA